MPYVNRAGLTPHQTSVLRLYALGYTRPQIAEITGRSHSSTGNVIQDIRLKYAERGRPAPVQAALRERAIEDHLIGPHDWATYLKETTAVKITVIATPTCHRCKTTALTLGRYNLAHEYRTDDDALELARSLGYSSVPVVVVQDPSGEITQHWSGHRPDLIRSLSLSADCLATVV